MVITSDTARSGAVDRETGRLLPLSDEERRARLEALARLLTEIPEADATDSDEAWGEVFRGIDEGRPHRPLFEGRH